ncbi:LOW QUALITY PROTEIN: hypothetical protein HID58_087500 [Brassica napus]|uniref:Uncharacterized protein n=1 Tax=Brassica napus TaxID=3708 RepID=A0ABQ7XTH8_BRANA|nr:LOW QUALITY PROTEIN: hypothetical protein HID58_087500 [Brassica napus]
MIVIARKRAYETRCWSLGMPEARRVEDDVVVKENESHASLMSLAHEKYRVDPIKPVSFTLDENPGDYTTPHVDILEDGDVELFMAVRLDYVKMKIFLSIAMSNVTKQRGKNDEEDSTRGYKGAQVDPRKRGSSYEYMQCRGKGKDSENDTVFDTRSD